MNYELAKQLKDVGFPFKPGDNQIDPEAYIMDDGESYFYPTLSELIEACGDGIDRLWKVDLSYDDGKSKWCATGTNDFLDGLVTTPEEAVANLWIALNKKS